MSKKTAEAVKTLLTPALTIKAAKDCDLVSTNGRAVLGRALSLLVVRAGVLQKHAHTQPLTFLCSSRRRGLRRQGVTLAEGRIGQG